MQSTNTEADFVLGFPAIVNMVGMCPDFVDYILVVRHTLTRSKLYMKSAK